VKTVLVTRPSPDGETTCAALAAAAIPARHVPVMTIQHRPAPLPPRADYGALLFTSANGVRAWLAAGGPRDVPAYFVGPASAAEGRAAGIRIVATGHADVADIVGRIDLQHAPILHVRGAAAAGDSIAALAGRGITARAQVLYEAQPITRFDPETIDLISEGRVDVALFSPRTARLFGDLCRYHDLDLQLGSATAFCLSPAVATAAGAFPFGEVVAATQPHLSAFVDMLKLRRT
jgi:uroporphyrinogen-III synthase